MKRADHAGSWGKPSTAAKSATHRRISDETCVRRVNAAQNFQLQHRRGKSCMQRHAAPTPKPPRRLLFSSLAQYQTCPSAASKGLAAAAATRGGPRVHQGHCLDRPSSCQRSSRHCHRCRHDDDETHCVRQHEAARTAERDRLKLAQPGVSLPVRLALGVLPD